MVSYFLQYGDVTNRQRDAAGWWLLTWLFKEVNLIHLPINYLLIILFALCIMAALLH